MAKVEDILTERVEKLETALNTIWIGPMTIKLAQEIAGNALAVDDCLVKAALKEQEAKGERS